MKLYWHVYVRRETIFAPVVADTPSGYMDMDPVAVFSAREWHRVRGFVSHVLNSGNPPAPGYLRHEFPRPHAFAGSGVHTWSAFKKGAAAIGWSISDDACRVDYIKDIGAVGPAGYEPVVVAAFQPHVREDEFVDCILQYVRKACDAQRG